MITERKVHIIDYIAGQPLEGSIVGISFENVLIIQLKEHIFT